MPAPMAAGGLGLADPARSHGPAGTAPSLAHAATGSVPLGNVPIEIGLRSLAGVNRFDIRLDPAELGCIEVSLEIDRERGEVKARLQVDRVETLALLQRDARGLEQAFEQAGLKSSGTIEVTLRDGAGQGWQGGGRGGEEAPRHGSGGRTGTPVPDPVPGASPPPSNARRGAAGVDLRI